MAQINLQTRVVGSGNTFFRWRGDLLGYARTVAQTGVQPVAQAEVIQPLNATRPLEIITPGAHTNGVLTLTLIELYGHTVWQRMKGLTNCENVVDIMRSIAALNDGVQMQKVMRSPKDSTTWIETFYNCVITRVAEDETISIEAMSVNKEIEVWYTHSDKSWVNGSSGSVLDRPLV